MSGGVAGVNGLRTAAGVNGLRQAERERRRTAAGRLLG